MIEDTLIKASDCKCCVCGEQAEVFWPIIDPDIPSNPYCKKCVKEAQYELLLKLHEIDDKYKKGGQDD